MTLQSLHTSPLYFRCTEPDRDIQSFFPWLLVNQKVCSSYVSICLFRFWSNLICIIWYAFQMQMHVLVLLLLKSVMQLMLKTLPSRRCISVNNASVDGAVTKEQVGDFVKTKLCEFLHFIHLNYIYIFW